MTYHCAVISEAEQKHVYFFLAKCLKTHFTYVVRLIQQQWVSEVKNLPVTLLISLVYYRVKSCVLKVSESV